MKPPGIEWIQKSAGGKNLAKWVKWARKRADWLYRSGMRQQERITMPDGSRVELEIIGTFKKIRVTGGAGGVYQFVGTADRLFKTFRDPSYPTGFDRMLPLGYAVHVSATNGQPVARPLFSSAETPPSDRYWPYAADPRDTDAHLLMSPVHQPDGMGSHQYFGPTTDIPKRNIPHLVSTWQQALPCSGLGWYGSGSASRFTTLDMNFDRGPMFFSVDPLKGSAKIPHSDWYGRAAYRTVSNAQYGARTFVIMVDANSVFYCFPTEGYGPTPIWTGWLGEQGNVPAELTKSQPCPWPSWVTSEPLGISAINAGVPDKEHRGRLRPLWSFNHAGTRAACVTGHRFPNWGDSQFSSSYYDDTGTLDTLYKEDLPGFVEVAFSVEISGASLADFTFSVSVSNEAYSGNPGVRAPVAVGYALRPMGDTPLDALLVLEYIHFTDSPTFTAGPAGSISGTWREGIDPPLYDLKRPNKATVAAVKRWGGTGWVEVRRWLAYYACYPPLGDARLFEPKIEQFTALQGSAGYANHFRYIATMMAMDLDSLSFCLYATARTIGDIGAGGGFVTYGGEAACVKTLAFDAEQNRQTLGHAELKPVVSAMLDLAATYPDLASMSEVFPAATLDYAHYHAAWETDPIILATRYATLTVRDGAGGQQSRLVQGASESMMGYSNIPNVPAFSGASHVFGPKIYTFFDGSPSVRPGMRYAVASALQPGTLSFSGYPYGAIHHDNVLFLTTAGLNNVTHRFSVHRSGAWAIFAGPFAARTDLAVWWVNGNRVGAPPLAYEQTVLDRISLRDDNTGNRVATTHIDMLNQAFGKALTPQQYHFELRYQPDTGAEFRPASDDPTAHGWYPVTHLSPLSVIGAHQFFSADRWYSEFCFDPAFVTRKPHLGYNSFTTFPTPRQEGWFLPPGT